MSAHTKPDAHGQDRSHPEASAQPHVDDACCGPSTPPGAQGVVPTSTHHRQRTGRGGAPARARANMGLTLGAASTGTAIETADVARMDDDLRKLPRFLRLSRHTHALLVQNIVLALGIKAVFLVLALTGAGTMRMVVFADMGASLLVVANGLQLLRK